MSVSANLKPAFDYLRHGRTIKKKLCVLQKKYVVFFLVCYVGSVLFSCKGDSTHFENLYVPTINKLKCISTEALIPHSYQFSSVPRKHKDRYYYFDRNIGSLVVLGNEFNFVKSVQIRGDGPKLLGAVYEFSVAGDYFFFMGNRILVVNMNTHEKYGPFQNPFELMQDVEPYKEGFLTGHAKNKGDYFISYFELDTEKGLINVADKARIDFEKGVHQLDRSGHLAVFEQSVVFVKDWSGEAYSFDYGFNLKNKKQLDFSGNLELNKNKDHDGISYNFYQAYSIEKTPNNLLAVMREVDFEDNDNLYLTDINEELVRKKIHFFDEELNYKGGIKLKYFSTDIHFYNNKLLTLNYEDELVFSYTLSE